MVLGGKPTIRADIVALMDAVEVELFVGSVLGRRLRFLRDTQAARYAAEIARRLCARGYRVLIEPSAGKRTSNEE